MWRSVRAKLGSFLKDAIAPVFCVQCGAVGGWLCSECAEQILWVREQVCYRCGKLSEQGKTCQRCRRHSDLNGVMVATHYEAGPIREMIHQLKYEGMTELAGILAWIGYRELVGRRWNDWMIVPLPLHRRRLTERGFNQAELLARGIARQLNLEFQSNRLMRVRATQQQIKLRGRDRRHNVYQAFRARDVHNRKVLVIDDVMTTGATLEDCARALKDAGASQVWAGVVARG